MHGVILIDTDTYRILKRTQTTEQCEFWRELLIPSSNHLITFVAGKSFSVFTGKQLAALYSNCFAGAKLPPTYNLALRHLVEYCEKIELDTTSEEDLRKRLKRDIPKPLLGGRTEPMPVYEKKPQVKKASARPKPGSATGRVWEIADSLYTEGTTIDKVFRTKLIEECTANGINPSTAATQYSKWKKFKESES